MRRNRKDGIAQRLFVPASMNALFLSGVANAQPLYRVTSVVPKPAETLEDQYSSFGLTDDGLVVGFFDRGTNDQSFVFDTKTNQMIILRDSDPTTWIHATDINQNGEVSGWYQKKIGQTSFKGGFLWRKGQFVLMGEPVEGDSVQGASINDDSVICTFDRYVWFNGTYQPQLPDIPGASFTRTWQIANDGTVVGTYDDENFVSLIAVWRIIDGQYTVTSLAPPAGFTAEDSHEVSDDSAWIIGRASNASETRGVIWTDDEIILLEQNPYDPRPLLGQAFPERGLVVGGSLGGFGCVWHDGEFALLDNLVVNSPGWSFLPGGLSDINRFGQVVGGGLLNGVETHAVLSPTTVVDPPAPGRAGEVNAFTGHGIGPANTASFYGALALGSASVSGCPGLTVGLRQPVKFGTATAGADWSATLTRNVPGNLRGRTVYLQCVDTTWCIAGEIATFVFE